MNIVEHHGTVAQLHGLPMPTEGDEPEAWLMRPSAPAVAMGSAQKPGDFDEAAVETLGLQLAPRRSGGGAVFIDPAHMLWIDLVAPRSSRWWSQDLTQNFLLAGEVWRLALADLGVESRLCAAAPSKSELARAACWAATGWGEVMVGDAKFVGLSQRRNRWGMRMQAMAVLDASAARIADVLPPELREPARAAIATSHVPVLADAGVTPALLEAAVLTRLGAIS